MSKPAAAVAKKVPAAPPTSPRSGMAPVAMPTEATSPVLGATCTSDVPVAVVRNRPRLTPTTSPSKRRVVVPPLRSGTTVPLESVIRTAGMATSSGTIGSLPAGSTSPNSSHTRGPSRSTKEVSPADTSASSSPSRELRSFARSNELSNSPTVTMRSAAPTAMVTQPATTSRRAVRAGRRCGGAETVSKRSSSSAMRSSR